MPSHNLSAFQSRLSTKKVWLGKGRQRCKYLGKGRQQSLGKGRHIENITNRHRNTSTSTYSGEFRFIPRVVRSLQKKTSLYLSSNDFVMTNEHMYLPRARDNRPGSVSAPRMKVSRPIIPNWSCTIPGGIDTVDTGQVGGWKRTGMSCLQYPFTHTHRVLEVGKSPSFFPTYAYTDKHTHTGMLHRHTQICTHTDTHTHAHTCTHMNTERLSSYKALYLVCFFRKQQLCSGKLTSLGYSKYRDTIIIELTHWAGSSSW